MKVVVEGFMIAQHYRRACTIMTMLDPLTIDNFAKNFFGYGNLSAPLWFIGMEEGGPKDLDEFRRRVDAWARLGHAPLVDLVDFHQQIGVTRWFEPKRELQSTWRPLVRVVLAATNRDASDEAQRSYQATRLARADGETALLELLPLPSRSKREWPYAHWGLETYETRRVYEKAFRGRRLQSILHLIEIHQPRVAVCYGNSRFWTDTLKLQPSSAKVRSGRIGDTVVISTIHSTARGSSNELWDGIGGMVREHLALNA